MANGINRGIGTGGSSSNKTVISNDLEVGGDAHFLGDVLIDGNLTVVGTINGGSSPVVALDQPSNLAKTASTTTSATLSWSQTGTIPDGWLLYIRLDSASSFPSVPLLTIPYTGSPSVTIPNLQPSTYYDVEIVAYKGSTLSNPALVRFTTDAVPVSPTNRVVTISAAMLATAIAAANAAPNGSKNAAFTASLISTLGASPKGIITSVASGTKHTEVLTLSSSATELVVAANAASFTSSVATDPNVTQDLYFEIQKASDATVKIQIPAGVASQADAKYILSGAWTLNQQVRRPAAFECFLPVPSFDTTGSSSLTQLKKDMTEPFEAQPNQNIFGYGAGNSGVITWCAPYVKGMAAYGTGGLDPNGAGHLLLPWFLIMPAYGNVNNSTFYIEMWNYNCYIYVQGSGWINADPSYPTNFFAPAFYGSGSPNSVQGYPNQVTLSNGHLAFAPPTQTGQWVMHNSIGQGVHLADPATFKAVCAWFDFRFCAIPGAEAQFNPSAAKMVAVCGVDMYPDTYPAGFITGGNGSTGRLISSTQKRLAMTMFKDNGGLIEVQTPLDPTYVSRLQTETWLNSNPPPGWS